ncbi:MAG: hypothetical protein Sw2LagTSB_12810 [Shewanella algae]
MIEIYTDRLRLRTLTAQDWPAFLALHCDPEVGRFVREPEPQEQIKAKFEQRSQPWRYESGDWLTLVIEELGSDCFVGLTGFYCVDPELAQAEVGYLLHLWVDDRAYGLLSDERR